MKDADEYDKLWKSRSFEIDKTIQTPSPSHSPTPNPNTLPQNSPSQATQAGGMTRRDLLIFGGTIGIGFLTAAAMGRFWQPTTIPERPAMKSTEVPKPNSTLTRSVVTPEVARLAFTSTPKPTEILKPTETPKPSPTKEPTQAPTAVITPTRETAEIERKAQEILGSDFLGYEAIKTLEERLNALGNNLEFLFENMPPFPYSIRDIALAKENNEMLVLRASTIWRRAPKGLSILGIDQPISLINFWNLFPQTDSNSQLYIAHSDDWTNTPLSTGEGEIQAGWSLVRKEPLITSTNKTWEQQEASLNDYGTYIKKEGGSQINARRRSGTETVWDITLDKIVNNRNQLVDVRDWTRSIVPDGRHVYVKRFKSNLQMLEMHATSLKEQDLGVYPMR